MISRIIKVEVRCKGHWFLHATGFPLRHDHDKGKYHFLVVIPYNKPLLTKFVPSRWLDIGLVLLFLFASSSYEHRHVRIADSLLTNQSWLIITYVVPLNRRFGHSGINRAVGSKRTWPVSSLNIWLAPRAGKMNRIARCDWPPERARWSQLNTSRITRQR